MEIELSLTKDYLEKDQKFNINKNEDYSTEKLKISNLLLKKNDEFKKNFNRNFLFQLMKSGKLSSKEQKERFLNYFQVWSDYFQRCMLIKTAFCEDITFLPVFNQHFEEELGHNKMLKTGKKPITVKEPILEAICTWFFCKMITFNQYEKIVIMNLCVEACATIFYSYAKPAIDPKNEMKHFQAHGGEVDEIHEKMGFEFLEDLNQTHYKRLLEVQEETWSMLEALMHRLGELSIQKS